MDDKVCQHEHFQFIIASLVLRGIYESFLFTMESLFFSKYQIDEDANKAKSREDLVHYSLAAFGEFIQLINEIDFFKGNSSKLFSAALMSFLYVIIDMKKNFVGAI